MGFITNPGGINKASWELFFLMEHDFSEKQKGSRFYRPHQKSDIPALGQCAIFLERQEQINAIR